MVNYSAGDNLYFSDFFQVLILNDVNNFNVFFHLEDHKVLGNLLYRALEDFCSEMWKMISDKQENCMPFKDRILLF